MRLQGAEIVIIAQICACRNYSCYYVHQCTSLVRQCRRVQDVERRNGLSTLGTDPPRVSPLTTIINAKSEPRPRGTNLVFFTNWRSLYPHARRAHSACGLPCSKDSFEYGSLHRATPGSAYNYRVRTRGDIEQMSHAHRLRTRTRGLASVVELQQDTRSRDGNWDRQRRRQAGRMRA